MGLEKFSTVVWKVKTAQKYQTFYKVLKKSEQLHMTLNFEKERSSLLKNDSS